MWQPTRPSIQGLAGLRPDRRQKNDVRRWDWIWGAAHGGPPERQRAAAAVDGKPVRSRRGTKHRRFHLALDFAARQPSAARGLPDLSVVQRARCFGRISAQLFRSGGGPDKGLRGARGGGAAAGARTPNSGAAAPAVGVALQEGGCERRDKEGCAALVRSCAEAAAAAGGSSLAA
ncbi:MAG: hypothetical protein J3K34DRAFT_136814 [Monoraphidium minutum]|nr:MAG: hypothetical protein J3K34DRAFT_136814 [Monoraphidium minutum]